VVYKAGQRLRQNRSSGSSLFWGCTDEAILGVRRHQIPAHKRERGGVAGLHASSFPNNRLKPKAITAPPLPPVTNHPAVLPIP
jgi:hypothetical protein